MINGLKRFSLNGGARRKALLSQTKKEENLIYGGQALKARMGSTARDTNDFDIFSKKPMRSARKTEKTFDKIHGANDFYIKPGSYKYTKKVMWKGVDGKKGTSDDQGVVDYTKHKGKIPFIKIHGVKYSTLGHEMEKKEGIIKNKQFKYRHRKDQEDINRIKFFGRRL